MMHVIGRKYNRNISVMGSRNSTSRVHVKRALAIIILQGSVLNYMYLCILLGRSVVPVESLAQCFNSAKGLGSNPKSLLMCQDTSP